MNRIRELREAAGMYQDELGTLLNVGKGAISRYELGKRQLDPPTICALCDFFGCTADYLLGRSNNRLSAFSDDEAALIVAFREAEPNIQKSILLQLNLLNPESKKDAAVS